MGGDKGVGTWDVLSLPKPLPVKAFRNDRIFSKGGAFDIFRPSCYKYGSPPESVSIAIC
jgi:hypothetical protein